MLTLKIDIDVDDEQEAQWTLEHISKQIGEGFVSGIDWIIEENQKKC